MFKYEDWMYHQYRMDGYIIFRGVLPWTLVRDLRKQAAKAIDIARRESGPQAQRTQPILKRYADLLDTKPFEDYLELPVLRDAVHRILSPSHIHGTRDLKLLIEPARNPWHLGWHRDGVSELPDGAYDDQVQDFLARSIHDEQIWNQVNCALYAESCTWFVPGSHLRIHDLPGEAAIPPISRNKVGRMNELDPVEGEYQALEDVQSMPGATQVHLHAGDFFLYRNIGWHNGNYLTYQPRATIHDIVFHPGAMKFYTEWENVKIAAVDRHKR